MQHVRLLLHLVDALHTVPTTNHQGKKACLWFTLRPPTVLRMSRFGHCCHAACGSDTKTQPHLMITHTLHPTTKLWPGGMPA